MSRWRIGVIIIILIYLTVNAILLYYQPSATTNTCHCPSTTTRSIPTAVTNNNIHNTATLITTSTARSPTVQPTVQQSSVPIHHRLAVLVPFRDRWEELMIFVPYMNQFLTNQHVLHEIWIIHQTDNHRFNRAMLMNAGYELTSRSCDYLVMHDVDLLPRNPSLNYSYPSNGSSPYHISAPHLHPLYHYKKYIGGILMMTREDFKKVNGMTNIFWGWGREDDELYLRIKEAGLQIHRPTNISTGNRTFIHNHDKNKRQRDMKSYGSQWKLSRRRDRESGLNTLKFHLSSLTNITVNGSPAKLANVQLHCDYDKTPFCDHQQ